MAIYKLTYYVYDAPKKLRRKTRSKYVIYERTFHLKELASSIQERLFDLVPFFDDFSNLNLTVDFQKVKTTLDQNYSNIYLGHLNDIYYLFGLAIDMESIIVSSGQVAIDVGAPKESNRAYLEMPKVKVCVPHELQEFYSFSRSDEPSFIIKKAYEYYIELIRHLRMKFEGIQLRKEQLVAEYEQLKLQEEDRLNQLKTLEAEAYANYQKEKYQWISDHGSEHLRFLYSLNYEKDCDRFYIKERVAKELEGWMVDFDNQVTYLKCQLPSKNALAYKQWARNRGYESDVVLINNQKEEVFRGYEAVMIRNYLDRYKLYKQVL